MVSESVIEELLVYLKKGGPANTFRLARVLGIDRQHLLDIIRRLEAKGALTVKSGVVQFLRFLPEEKREAPPRISKPKKVPKAKKPRKPAKSGALQLLQAESKQLKEKLLELEETVKKLEKKPIPLPKIITKNIIKKAPISQLKEKLLELEETMRELEKKVSAPPKTITKTVIKKIPVPPPKIPKKKKAKKRRKIKKKSKIKFKIFKFGFLKNIKQLKKPEFVK